MRLMIPWSQLEMLLMYRHSPVLQLQGPATRTELDFKVEFGVFNSDHASLDTSQATLFNASQKLLFGCSGGPPQG